jgi:hypothetical protein
MRLGAGGWFHAFELRFLLSDGALSPLGQRESLKNKSAYFIETPDGFVLYANLIIGSPGTPLDCRLPLEFTPAGQTLWRTRLRDGRPAVLVARLLELDDQNSGHIRYLREELKPTATFSATPKAKYIEVYHLHWSPAGGNVILVVPMGEEACRSEDELMPYGVPLSEPRHFWYRSTRSTAIVIAPNGLIVAVVELAEVEEQIELVNGIPKLVELGLLTMQLEPSNLIPGGKFIAAPQKLVCLPNIGGGSPRNWEYIVHARFDGSCLSAELRQNSTSLQNRNLTEPLVGLGANEEITITIPADTIKLASTLDVPSTSTQLVGRFTLREQRPPA